MLKTRLFFLFLIVISTQNLNAQVLQNLVRNPSFEVYKTVPSDLGQVDRVTYWSSPNEATPDFFHRRASGPNVDIPSNKMGSTKARTGYAYAGFYAYASRYSKRDFREYVQVQLKQPMYPGETYCVKAHVYLSESSNRAIGALGVAAARQTMVQEHQHQLGLHSEYMIQENRRPLNQRGWVEIKAEYEALGGERYIIIGNFDDDKKTKVTGAVEIDSFRNPHVDFAYYYIDDVCVTSLRSNFACDCGSFDYETTARRERIVLDMRLNRKTYNVGQNEILKSVVFEKDKALLLEGSEKELEDLVAVLKLNTNYELEISGHTDDKGNPKDNHFLSKRRAKAVYDFLVASGISEERLTYRGYGQARPIALNTSKEGRALNERVQFQRTK